MPFLVIIGSKFVYSFVLCFYNKGCGKFNFFYFFNQSKWLLGFILLLLLKFLNIFIFRLNENWIFIYLFIYWNDFIVLNFNDCFNLLLLKIQISIVQHLSMHFIFLLFLHFCFVNLVKIFFFFEALDIR